MPAGHRLVIQHVNGNIAFNSRVSEVNVFVSSSEGFSGFLPPFTANGTQFDQLVQLYVDAGDLPIVSVGGDNPVSSGSVTLTGYLLDCIAAPCAKIAQ